MVKTFKVLEPRDYIKLWKLVNNDPHWVLDHKHTRMICLCTLSVDKVKYRTVEMHKNVITC